MMNSEPEPSNQALVACLRCRRQKLRCSREKPACQRCERFKSQCLYPQPPDRRKLAKERMRHAAGTLRSAPRHHFLAKTMPSQYKIAKASNRPDDGSSMVGSTQSGKPPDEASQYVSQLESRCISCSDDDVPSVFCGWKRALVSKEVALLLVEIFFGKHYQSDLLFHREELLHRFLASDSAGGVEDVVTITELTSVNWKRMGEHWAETASKRVLMHADKPSLEQVQACQTLALFWFAKSQFVRANIHNGIAYRSCQLMHYNRIGGNKEEDEPTNANLKVRCFWATWLTQCANHRQSLFQKDCWTEMAECPLPEPDRGNSQTADWEFYMGKDGSTRQRSNALPPCKITFYPALITAQGLWWQIQKFHLSIQQSYLSDGDLVLEFFDLDGRLQDLEDQMVQGGISVTNDVEPTTQHVQSERLFSLNFMHHLCFAYLHASVVPLLSCSSRVPVASRSILRMAAEKAFKHATAFINVANIFVSHKGEISNLWPVVGFGCYVSTTIRIRCLLAQGNFSLDQIQELRVSLTLISQLERFWDTLKPLYAELQKLFSQAELLAVSCSGSPQDASSFDDTLLRSSTIPTGNLSPALSSSAYLATWRRSDQLPLDLEESRGQQRAADVTTSATALSIGEDTLTVCTNTEDTLDICCGSGNTVMERDLDWWEQGVEIFAGVFDHEASIDFNL